MRIEAAGMDDLDRLVELWVELVNDQRQYGSHLLGDPNRSHAQSILAYQIVAGTVFVARENGIRGFVSFEIEEDLFERSAARGIIQNIYVEPCARRKGAGSALLDTAENAILDAGVEIVTLEAMAENQQARQLYRQRGYDPYRIEYERQLESDTHSKVDEVP